MRIAQNLLCITCTLELARQNGKGPLSIAHGWPGHPTAIPAGHHGELRQGGFVESRRGKDGGYILVIPTPCAWAK